MRCGLHGYVQCRAHRRRGSLRWTSLLAWLTTCAKSIAPSLSLWTTFLFSHEHTFISFPQWNHCKNTRLLFLVFLTFESFWSVVLVSIGVKSSCIRVLLLFSTMSATNLGLIHYLMWNHLKTTCEMKGLRSGVDAGAEPVLAFYLCNQVSECWPKRCQQRAPHGRFHVHKLGEHQPLGSKFGRLAAQRCSSGRHALSHWYLSLSGTTTGVKSIAASLSLVCHGTVPFFLGTSNLTSTLTLTLYRHLHRHLHLHLHTQIHIQRWWSSRRSVKSQ